MARDKLSRRIPAIIRILYLQGQLKLECRFGEQVAVAVEASHPMAQAVAEEERTRKKPCF